MAEESFGFGSAQWLSQIAQGNLRRATDTLSQSIERLSSGQRINSASDDAASLSVASRLKADQGIYATALQNVNQAISLNNMASDGLVELQEIATRQLELATQAESETLSYSQRSALEDEANALVDEYNRIIESTKWNDLKPYDGTLEKVDIQAGDGTEAVIPLQYGQYLGRTAGAGDFEAAATHTSVITSYDIAFGDVNEDGNIDMITGNGSTGALINLGNGDGSFSAPATVITGGGTNFMVLADVNNDTHLDLVTTNYADSKAFVVFGQGDGTFGTAASYSLGSTQAGNIVVDDFDGDSYKDIAVANENSPGLVSVLKNDGDGTFGAAATYQAGLDTRRIRTEDFNGDNKQDILTINVSGDATLLLGKGDGTFEAQITLTGTEASYDAATGDFNGDGHIDFALTNLAGSCRIMLGCGDGTFTLGDSHAIQAGSRSIVAADFNNDNNLDLAYANANGDYAKLLLGKGDGSFLAGASVAAGDFPFQMSAEDLNNDGILDLGVADLNADSVTILIQKPTLVSTMPRLNLMSAEDAEKSAQVAAEALARVNNELGMVEAQQSRLSAAVLNIHSAELNFEAAYSRIMDVDVAKEMARYVRTQIIRDGATAMLAQANLEMARVGELISNTVNALRDKE